MFNPFLSTIPKVRYSSLPTLDAKFEKALTIELPWERSMLFSWNDLVEMWAGAHSAKETFNRTIFLLELSCAILNSGTLTANAHGRDLVLTAMHDLVRHAKERTCVVDE